MDNVNALELLKQEMVLEEINVKVNAIHRLKTVILSIGQEATIAELIPYLDSKSNSKNILILKFFCSGVIAKEDDEVLFAVAEELGKCFHLIDDKTVFLASLETLARQDETVVRNQAAESLTAIISKLSDAEI